MSPFATRSEHDVRLRLWRAPLLVALLAGCGRIDEDGAGGSGGSGTMTTAEWQALIGPRSGLHDVWSSDGCEDPHAGSTSAPAGQEYRIMPSLTYIRDFENEAEVAYDALVQEPACYFSADCTELPNGVCQGTLGAAYCHYSDPPPPELCSTDADCMVRPDGACVHAQGFDMGRICFPTGVCHDPSGECSYAGDGPCEDDADCTEGADGECIHPIVNADCNYGACFDDADCGPRERCGCGGCVPAACVSDESCPENETCEVSPGDCILQRAFHCSTPDDTCVAGEAGCYYGERQGVGSWGPPLCLIK